MLLKMRGGSAIATGSAPTARKQSNKVSNKVSIRRSSAEIDEMGVGLALMFAAFFALVLADMAVAL